MTEKHYDVRIPTVLYGLDMGLPLDPEVRKFLQGFHKNEILKIADEFEAKVAAGEDPTYIPGVGLDLSKETDGPKPGDDRLENDILASIGEEAEYVEVEVDYVEEENVPLPAAPVVLETRDVDVVDERDNYDDCDRDDLYEEARKRKLAGIAPKIGKAKLIEKLRRHDATGLLD